MNNLDNLNLIIMMIIGGGVNGDGDGDEAEQNDGIGNEMQDQIAVAMWIQYLEEHVSIMEEQSPLRDPYVGVYHGNVVFEWMLVWVVEIMNNIRCSEDIMVVVETFESGINGLNWLCVVHIMMDKIAKFD